MPSSRELPNPGLNLRLTPPASSAGFLTARDTRAALLIEVVLEFFHGKDGVLSRGWKLFIC